MTDEEKAKANDVFIIGKLVKAGLVKFKYDDNGDILCATVKGCWHTEKETLCDYVESNLILPYPEVTEL